MPFRLLMRGGTAILFIIGLVASLVKRNMLENKPTVNATNHLLSQITSENAIVSLDDKRWRVRVTAIRKLKELSADVAIPALLKALGDEDPDVRSAASSALADYQNEAVSGLIEVLQVGEQSARIAAGETLVSIGSDESYEALMVALKHDESSWVRILIADALGATGDSRYTLALIDALNDSHPDVYSAVVEALKKIGTVDALQAIDAHPFAHSQ